MPGNTYYNMRKSQKLADQRLDERMKEQKRRLAQYRKDCEEMGIQSQRLKEIDEARKELRDKTKEKKSQLLENQDMSKGRRKRQAWRVGENEKKTEWKVVLKDLGRQQATKAALREKRRLNEDDGEDNGSENSNEEPNAKPKRKPLRLENDQNGDANEEEESAMPPTDNKPVVSRDVRRDQYKQRTRRGQPIMKHRVQHLMEKALRYASNENS
eukprot:PhF_6_TR18552/c0_g1_i1/m.27102